MNFTRLAFPLTPLFVSCCFSLPTFAETTSSTSLDTLEVEADSVTEEHFTGEQSTEQLSMSVAQNLQDTFQTDPSVQIGTGSRNGQKIFLRGVEDLNVNVKVDGAKQNANNFHHQGRVQVDPFLLKRAQVITGPAAADAGPGALGGSVVFETVDAQDKLRDGQTIGGEIGTQYESASDLVGGNLAVYGKVTEELGLLVYTRKNSNNNIRAGGGESLKSTNGEHENYLIKASLLDKNDHSVRLSTQRSTDDGGALRANFPWQTNEGTVKAGDDQRITDESINLQHNYNPKDNSLIDIKQTFYTTKTTLDRYLDTGDIEWATEGHGANINNTSRFETGTVFHALTYGVDYQHTKGISIDSSESLSEDSQNTGLYIQNRADLGHVRLSGGLRYDYYEANYDGKHQSTGDAVSPNISAEWDISDRFDEFTLFAGYGESIRGDRLNQSGWLNKYTDDFVLGDNGSLEPETSIQYEWGARWSDSNVFTDKDRTGLKLSFYDTTIEDYLITNGEGLGAETDRIYNADGDVTSQGFELSAFWEIETLAINMTYSHNRFRDYEGLPGDTTGTSARVGSSVGDRLTLSTLWQYKPNMKLGYTATAVDRLTDVRPNSPEKPGFLVHDIQWQWQPLIAKNDLEVTLALENVFDTRYAEHTTVRYTDTDGTELASWEKGRNLRVGLNYRF